VKRRDALRTLAAGGLGTVLAPSWVEALQQVAHDHAQSQAAAPAMAAASWTPRVFTASQNEQVVALTEAIIPATETPGAKAALVNRFIDQVLADAGETQRRAFLNGLAWIGERSQAEFGKDFAAATPEQQTALLMRIDDEGPVADGDKPGADFFRAIKGMTISGYYSTEIGLRQELGDDGRMVLAEFEGCTHPEHQG
jgi:uncharacterized protein involved in copper resistance